MAAPLPRLRERIEAIPVKRGGQVHIALRDLEGMSANTLLLSPEGYFLLSFLDGTNNMVDLQAAYMRRFGQMLFRETIEDLLQQLDANFLLDNDRSRRRRDEIIEEFRRAPVRPPYHQGSAYEADPERLRQQLLDFFTPDRGGPGIPAPGGSGPPVLGLVAPHIDLRAGGVCFAHAYWALLQGPPVGTCIILGTCHQPLTHGFALCRKPFATPLGTALPDDEVIDFLLSSCEFDLLRDEIAHRREHTIEFQTVFLQFLLPQTRIVPILCAFGVEELQRRAPEITTMAALLRQVVDKRPAGVCLLASVDLAHIGPRYGDSFRPDEGTVRDNEAADRRMLEVIANCDAEAFADLMVREGNRRRICGLPPLSVLLAALAGRACGQLLRYDRVTVDDYGSFVSFASMAFYAQDRGQV